MFEFGVACGPGYIDAAVRQTGLWVTSDLDRLKNMALGKGVIATP